MTLQSESPLTITIHVAQFTATLGVLGILLKQHAIWTRMKDRLNSLWRKHCKEIGEEYVPLENGKR